MTTGRMNKIDVRSLPLWAAVLPLLTFNVCYLVAVALEHVPACIPYVSGCTSVSSAGRMAPESWIFKAGMLPLAVIVLLVWWRCSAFLEGGGQTGRRLWILRLLGATAALSLLLYTATLGIAGDDYRSLRRIGIDGFALSNFIAQVILVVSYRHMATDRTRRIWRWLAIICVAVPAIAVAGELAKWLGAPRHPVNNVMAWNALLLQCLWFGLLGRLWRKHSRLV